MDILKQIGFVFLCLVLEEPFRDQIQRRFEGYVSEDPVLSETAGATVREPELSGGSLESKAPEPTLAVDPGLNSESAVVVDLAATGGQVLCGYL